MSMINRVEATSAAGLGVLTNDPPFEWHLQHLDEFAG